MKYDKVGQLLESEYLMDEDKLIRKYTYDESGNRILYEEEHNGNKIEKHSQYNANDELLNVDKSLYKYDKSGNVIEKIFEDGHSEKLQYNDYNELIKIESSLGKTIEYEYDALGNRISKEEDIAIEDKDILNYLKADVRMPDLKDIDDIDKALEKKMKEYEKGLSSDKLGKQEETWFKEEGIHLTTEYVNDISYENVQVLELIQEKGTETYTYGNERISLSYKDNHYNYIYDGKYNVIGEDGTLDNVYRYDDYGNIIQNINDGYGYSSESSEYKYQYLRARYYETSEGRFLQRDNYLGKKNTSDYNQYIYGLNNPQMYKDPSGHFIYDAFNAAIKVAKGYANEAIDSSTKMVNRALDMAEGLLKPFGYDKPIKAIKKTVNKAVPKIKKKVNSTLKTVEKAIDKAKKVAQTRASFLDYATKNGLEAAYAKYKNVDSSLLESMVKAYCDKLGLDYLSVKEALKSVAEVEGQESLQGKYLIICETIKNTVENVNVSAVQSNIGYSAESSMHKVYLSGAIKVLTYSRDLACSLVWNIKNIQSMISTTSSSLSNSKLNQEYSSSMIDHSADMGVYINTSGRYVLIKPWSDTGRYSGGTFGEQMVHKDSKSEDAYGNWVYKMFVPAAAGVQANADKIEFVAAIVGTMNQSYNPYQTAGSTASNSKGSGGSDYTSNGSTANSTTPNSNSGTANGAYGQSSENTNPSESYVTGGSTNPRPGTSAYIPPTKVRAEDIKFTDKFNDPKYATQVTDRLWNNQKIADAINNPYKVGDSVNKFTGNPVKVYYINDMHYVAVDDVTKKVVQVSDLNRNDWVFDLSK